MSTDPALNAHSADRLREALLLEERRLAKEGDRLRESVHEESLKTRSEFVKHGHGGGSSVLNAALIGLEIDRLRKLAQAACDIRREMYKTVVELRAPAQIDALKGRIRSMIEGQWATLHAGIARLVGGPAKEDEIRRLLDSPQFQSEFDRIKAEADREIEIIRGEAAVGVHDPHGANRRVEDNLCFVLMPFAAELTAVYVTAVRPAAEDAGLRCERADDTARPGVVLDQIDESIKQARILVADLTRTNPNVMQEVGFARAHRKPIVLITQTDFRDLPFDIRHYRTFRYQQDVDALRVLREWLLRSFREALQQPAPAQAQGQDLQLDLNWVQGNIQPQLEADGYELVYPAHARADQYRLEGWEDVLWPDNQGRFRRVRTEDHTPLRRRRAQGAS